MNTLQHPDKFVNRHIGPDSEEIKAMLAETGHDSINSLIDKTIPKNIRSIEELQLDEPLSEADFLKHLKSVAGKNKVYKSYIGMGYYPTILPAVIQRNVLENPGWYTQYTPYQAEISQGRLEALLNYQTLVIDLTGLPIANASLLDEGTAAAEAMLMFHALRKNKQANKFFISSECFPQTIDVVKTRAEAQGIELVTGDHHALELNDDYFGIFVQYPSGFGEIFNFSNLFEHAHAKGVYCVVAADLLSLTLLRPPGEFGADAVVGSSQRLGVPMGYGGPHAAFFSTKEDFKRHIPGRIIGVSVDTQGNTALRMALQTREQHIKREKATSNICTAQVLLAVISSMYAVYHGSAGLRRIAERIHLLSRMLENAVTGMGVSQLNSYYFDTLRFKLPSQSELLKVRSAAESRMLNFRYISDTEVGISLGEDVRDEDITEIIAVFEEALMKKHDPANRIEEPAVRLPSELTRTTDYLQHPVFNSFHSETEMLRYMKLLENKDLSLVHSMIPLGSCTMKLNATTEMAGITWPEFSNIHPFAPVEQAAGYHEIFRELEKDLARITGFAAVSLQPNSGAQGEFTGLLVIKAYHEMNGNKHRNVVLIPSSAHGTNPASAVMAGMKVVVVNCDANGNVDLEDLKKKLEQHKAQLSALMITYPSTHGVFEEDIVTICNLIHENGGLVYMDGANLNAQLGLTNPGIIGADVCHLNLHKTFCIPHGGGGPGMGPIGVAEHLVEFLPNHPVVKLGRENGISAVSAAPWGSANILIISYAYIKMMGAKGLTDATRTAILNANYIKAKLEPYFKVLYTGKNGTIGHELIFDMREFKTSANIEVEDIAKRLMDYGYHAPTVSFPVAGTLMVEPTESESKTEMDRFCEAMISIREEIREIESGTADATDNVLKNAPHTASVVISDEWKHSYSREKAAFPAKWSRLNKFWPSVGRVNSAYGDRNLVCSCNPISDYIEEITS